MVGGGERGAGGVGEGRRCFEGCWGEIGGKFEAEVFPKFYKSRSVVVVIVDGGGG